MGETKSREYHIDAEYSRLFAGDRRRRRAVLHGDQWPTDRFQQFSIQCKCKQHLSITEQRHKPSTHGTPISSILSSRHLTKKVHHKQQQHTTQQPQQQQTIVTFLTRFSVAGRRQCSKVRLRFVRPWTEPTTADRSQLEWQSTAGQPAAAATVRRPTTERWQLRKRSAAATA